MNADQPITFFTGPYQRGGKRILDGMVAAVSLLVVAPLFLVLASLIKLFDPGPIIFRQLRVGRGGVEFVFYKLRSMPVGTKNLPSDQLGQIRLTWIGRLLRRSNLDELPQLYLVLIGDMSLVGPRPPISSQKELLELRAQNGALLCRPGLTGLAQVSSYDGMSVSEKAAYDGRYAQHISLWGDIMIILRTFAYLLRPPPTY